MGGEATFGTDLRDPDAMKEHLDPIIEKVARRLDEKGKRGRTVTLKVKYADFEIITRRRTLERPVHEAASIRSLAHELLDALVPLPKGVRLLGVTVSGFPGDGARTDKDADGGVGEPKQLALL